jgi:hypothetical protein
MHASPVVVCGEPHAKVLRLLVRQRVLLHRLPHRDLDKCSMWALGACQRLGWVLGPGGGYQLTRQGRRMAELSEQAPAKGELAVAPS